MKSIGSPEEFDTLLKGDKPTVCIFTASWCGPCVGLKDKIKAEGLESSIAVNWVMIDVDEQEELSEKYDIEAMPTIMFFKSGSDKAAETVVGANFDKVKGAAEKLLN